MLYMLGRMAPSFQDHGTSACLSPPSHPHLAESPPRRTAKVWTHFQLVNELVGHTQPVWAVVALQGDEYLTGAPLHFSLFHVPVWHPLALGSADKTIKLWRQHKCLRTYHGHKDAVRTLALLTDIGFASGSNDRFVNDLLAGAVLTFVHSVKSQYGHSRGT